MKYLTTVVLLVLSLVAGLQPLGAAPVSISSVSASGGTEARNPAANAVDGDLSTRWSAKGSGEWIQFRLDACTPVDAVETAWYAGNRRVSTFRIETSEDGTAWTQVFQGKSSGTTDRLEPVHFPSRRACWLRIVAFGNTQGDWNSLGEVVIRGAGSGDGEIPLAKCPD